MAATTLPEDWPRCSGEMADLIRQHDWSASGIGAIAHWPGPLRTAIDVMLASGLIASVAWGPDLVVLYNDEMAGILDDHHPRLFGQPLLASLPPDRSALYVDRFARVRRGETVVIDTMHYPRQTRGEKSDAWLSARYLPLRDDSGDIVGMMTLATDITARVLAETRGEAADAARRRSEEMFGMLASSIEDVFYITNLHENRLEYLSPAFERIWGRPPDMLKDLSRFAETVHPHDHDRMRADKALQARGKPVTAEYRMIRPDGEQRWILDRSFPVLGAETIRSAGIASDITARKRQEDRLAGLYAELQHRTRNLMGVVRSMFEKSLETAPDLPTFATTFRNRLAALARVQGLLAQLDEGDRITFDALLRAELSSLELSGSDGPTPRITLRGPSGIRLRSATVQTFALALHELATNATRHGALSQPAGRLTVDWRTDRRDDSAFLIVDWQETGVAMPPPAPAGYGRELVERALPYQLDATSSLTFGPNGITCRIEIPLREPVRK